MRSRGYWEIKFEAKPVDTDLRDKHGIWAATAFVAGHADNVHMLLNDWLTCHGMEPGRYRSMKQLRKAKGREGPAVIAIEDQNWSFIDEDDF